ncbi:tetratricopeptide repeat protein [Noviherbaspirillum sp. UKPF54]|uniref:tetratricopeptide repeat protein n=1 Tax=Noviherbaspirillum sp. UKPF54 TaxID=2601898 RepID=UPI0011B18BD6|nr:tetratricopeptide repeat protein [Noviherbaspirillum sp. UKPF54]QDZ29051.1 tetratricopeptide repeat protein [Noviherbaspirillum sp. UKPF54]
MKTALLIVTLPLVLSACASWSQRPALPPLNAPDATAPGFSADGKLVKKQQVSRHLGSAESEPRVDDPLPSAELTEDVMYKVLSAEIAYQRGDWQTGYVTMLGLAQQTRDPRLARRAAEIALAAKEADEALAAVRLWRTLAPHSEEAAQYYLSFVILSDDLAEAKPLLTERLKEARPQTRGLLAFQVQRLLARAKDKAAAFALLEDLLKPYLDMPEARLALAQGAFAKGDSERARQEAQTALKLKPDSELAALSLAQVTTDKNEAAKSLSDFLARHPKARDVRMAYARMLVEQKQYGKARHEFEMMLKEQPQDLTALYALGVLSVQVNDFGAAEKYLTTYLNVLSANPEEERDPNQALLLLAQIAEERKDTDAVLKWLAQIEPGEAFLSAQIKRAQIIAKRGDMAQARQLLHELKANGEREQTQVISAEAQILRDANQLAPAMEVLKAGLKQYPDNTDLLYDYAMVAEKGNQLDIMETALRRIMELAPNNQHAYNALGYSLAERNIRLNEAYELIDKALKLAPEDPYIMDSMGWVQFRMGNLKEAESLLRRAYELRPDAEIAVHLGEVLWIKGQKADAQKFWRDAQTKDPQNDMLKSTLARLNVNL